MTEYWLQKKTIGGWSHVTSYQELEQAKYNYANCVGNGYSGYSWRLAEVTTIQEDMLNDVVKVEPLKLEPIKASWGMPARPAEILIQDAPKSVSAPVARPWGQERTSINPGATVLNSWGDLPADSERPKHGGAGKVCMINHVAKVRTKVDASQVEEYIKAGYVRGGPRTQFE